MTQAAQSSRLSEREKQRQTERERDRQREKETERQKQRDRERERQRERRRTEQTKGNLVKVFLLAEPAAPAALKSRPSLTQISTGLGGPTARGLSSFFFSISFAGEMWP